MKFQCLLANIITDPSCHRELRGVETRAAEIEKKSLQKLDTAHHQCQNKIELSQTRAENLCQEILNRQ